MIRNKWKSHKKKPGAVLTFTHKIEMPVRDSDKVEHATQRDGDYSVDVTPATKVKKADGRDANAVIFQKKGARQTPDGGVKVNGYMAIVEADDLVTSKDDGYPEQMQGRDRYTKLSETQAVKLAIEFRKDISRMFDNQDTDRGAPLVVMGNDGRLYVNSGNGRTAGMREAYRGEADLIKAAMVKYAKKRGGDESANRVSSMKNPMAVFIADTGMPLDALVKIANASNKPNIQQMSPRENALSDARALEKEDGVMDLLQLGEDGGESLISENNQRFYLKFIELTNSQNDGVFDNDGNPTVMLENRMQNALFAYFMKDLPREASDRLLKYFVENPKELGMVSLM